MPGPLEGIRVLEVANWVAAPACGAILADLGAEVIKVEPVDTGDPYRSVTTSTRGLVPAAGRVNAAFENDNRGKRSVGVNLESPQGQEVVRRLARQVDVFLTNLLPRRQERYRLRYEDLAPLNPRLIYASLTGFGPEGPDRDKQGFDYTAFWVSSGIMATLGEPDLPPVTQRPGMGDHTTSLALTAGIALALFERERSGKGQRVDLSLLHTGLWVIAMDLMAALYEKEEVRKQSRASVTNPLFNYYRTGDGRWLHLTMLESDRYWPNLCRALGLEHLQDDPRFADHFRRMEHAAELIRILDDVFATRTLAEWGERLDREGCIWAPVRTLLEVTRYPQARANRYFVPVPHPAAGELEVVRAPFTFSRTYSEPSAPAPFLGQDTEAVLLERGFSWEEIEALKEAGAIIR